MDSTHILIWWYGVCWDFMKQNEFLALWLEGLALVAIFIWDRIDARGAHEEALKQQDIWRRQIHADRVAGIYERLRGFLNLFVEGMGNHEFGPGARFDRATLPGYTIEPFIREEYNSICEAYYSSILVNEKFAAYVKERVDEAKALQGVDDTKEFDQRLAVFYLNWRGDVMAKRMRKLS
jgi:hypothetical protein